MTDEQAKEIIRRIEEYETTARNNSDAEEAHGREHGMIWCAGQAYAARRAIEIIKEVTGYDERAS